MRKLVTFRVSCVESAKKENLIFLGAYRICKNCQTNFANNLCEIAEKSKLFYGMNLVRANTYPTQSIHIKTGKKYHATAPITYVLWRVLLIQY